jgi:two-component system sensor histidine kinase HydH
MAKVTALNKTEILRKAIEIASSTVKPQTKIENVLKHTARELCMDKAFIFGLDKEKKNLLLRVANENIADWPDQAEIPVGKGLVGLAVKEKKPLVVHNELLAGESAIWDRFATRVALPILDDTFLYGALVLWSQETVAVDRDVIAILEAVCLELAGILRNFKLSLEAKRRISELSALFEIGKAISTHIDLQRLVNELVHICAKVVNARGALLTIFDPNKSEVIIKSAFGERLGDEIPPMCVGLNFQRGLTGSLCVYQKRSWEDGTLIPFDEEDARLLAAMASFFSSALEKSIVYKEMEHLLQKNEELVRRLSTLYDISSSMMTTVDFEEVLDIILQAIIVREGLGFDRAMIALIDDDYKVLRLYKWLSRPSIQEENSLILTPSESLPNVEPSRHIRSHLHMDLPFSEEGGPIAVSLLKGEATIITREPGDLKNQESEIYRILGLSFAVVPLVAKDKPIGAIVADHFAKGKEVTVQELKTLSMLAHQAALSIENSRLYSFVEGVNRELREAKEKLMETEKMAALGEITAGLAHEIRNPLVSIGGFARRLLKKAGEESSIKSYLDVIVAEVERLEKILRDVLDFSQESANAQFQLGNLNQTIQEALNYLKLEFEGANIQVIKDFSDIPPIWGDHRQLRHLFFNLFLNARQAMKQGGILVLRTYLDTTKPDPPSVKVEVTDSGGGIPVDILHNIFNPFFTTKAQGTGLGLSIVHRIIKRHQGDIEVDNKPGAGVSFIMTFPILSEAKLI